MFVRRPVTRTKVDFSIQREKQELWKGGNTIASHLQTFSNVTAVIGRLDAKAEIDSFMLSTCLGDIYNPSRSTFSLNQA